MARDREESSTRTRSRDRNEPAKSRGKSSAPAAIDFNPTTFESYGMWGDKTEVEILDAWIGIFNYGGKLSKDGKVQVSTSLFLNYLDLEEGSEHVEQVSIGSPRFYAPGNSQDDEDYAGGNADVFKGLASGESAPNDEMRGEYLLPVAQGYDSDGEPVYKQTKGSRGSNMDFYLQQLAECCKTAGIPLTFDPDDRSVRKLLVGFKGSLDRLGNTLRKNSGGGDSSKVLVFTEIFERAESGKSRSSSKANGKEEDTATASNRSRNRKAAETEPDDEPDEKPARRGKSSKKSNDGPDDAFLADFAEKVEAYLADQPKKASKRTRLTSLMDEYDDRNEAKMALDIITEDEYIESFWSDSKLFDYDADSDTVSL